MLALARQRRAFALREEEAFHAETGFLSYSAKPKSEIFSEPLAGETGAPYLSTEVPQTIEWKRRALTGRVKGFCVMAGKDHETMRDVLNRLTLKPRMKEAARNAGIHPTTLFGWIRKSAAGDPKMVLTWLGHKAPFHKHVVAARRLSVIAIDHVAGHLAINGHAEPRFHKGKPVWRRDAQIEADALALDEDTWKIRYGNRPRSDTFMRDENGALIQEVVVHPPYPANTPW